MTDAVSIKNLVVTLTALFVAFAGLNGIAAAQPEQSKTGGGLTVYLGVVPAEIVKGPSPHSTERPMHGRIPHRPNEYHVVAAVFDTATSARVADAAVTAQVSGLGLSGSSKKLEPMLIAGTTTYGNFFGLPGRDRYTVKLTIERSGGARPVSLTFKFDNR